MEENTFQFFFTDKIFLQKLKPSILLNISIKEWSL